MLTKLWLNISLGQNNQKWITHTDLKKNTFHAVQQNKDLNVQYSNILNQIYNVKVLLRKPLE